MQALLKPPSSSLLALIEHTLAWLQERGNAVFTLADAAYSRALLDIVDPPSVLYAKGRTDLLNLSALGIVGSRNASRQGKVAAARFAEWLSKAGWAICPEWPWVSIQLLMKGVSTRNARIGQTRPSP